MSEETPLGQAHAVDPHLDGFYYHRPGREGQESLGRNRARFRVMRDYLLTLPLCRERAVAVMKLQEAAMWANLAIVLYDPEAECRDD